MAEERKGLMCNKARTGEGRSGERMFQMWQRITSHDQLLLYYGFHYNLRLCFPPFRKPQITQKSQCIYRQKMTLKKTINEPYVKIQKSLLLINKCQILIKHYSESAIYNTTMGSFRYHLSPPHEGMIHCPLKYFADPGDICHLEGNKCTD